MRLEAALQGDLNQMMAQELDDATAGVQRGVQQATDLLKGRLRTQIRRAGFRGKTTRLEKTWQGKFYRNDGLNAAGLVYSKAPRLIQAHTEGTTIRARGGKYLAIPTENVPRRLFGKQKPSPGQWPARLGKLQFIPTRTGGVLVVKNYTRTRTGRESTAKNPKSRTVVMFVLIRQITLKKRLDPDAAGQRVANLLPELIRRNYRTTGA